MIEGVACIFINMIINDERFGVVVKDYLRRYHNFPCAILDQNTEENNSDHFLNKKRLRSESKQKQEDTIDKCNHQSLLFEMFIYKWQLSHLLNDTCIINVNSFKNSVTLMLLKYKLNTPNQIEFSHFGSMQSKTLRNDNIQLDYYILVNQYNGVMYNEFIDCVYNDANNNNYCIDYLPNEKYIQISSKSLSATIRILDHSQAEIFSKHALFLSNHTMTQENKMLIKILKSWRRTHSLLFLAPEVIEYLILNQQEDQPFFDNTAIVERIIYIFKTMIVIDKKEKETWGHLFPLVTSWESSNSNTLTKAAESAIEKIKQYKFDELL